MGNPFDLVALLLGLGALLGLANYHLLRLPHTVGLLAGALITALLLILLDRALPALGLRDGLQAMLARVDLPQTLLNGFLSYLLFAGAMETDFADMMQRKWTILALALAGTIISTVLVGLGFYGVSQALGLGVPIAWCFVFGALISPTDPVSVLEVLQRVGIPRGLAAVVAGESLFNDGIGVVLFTILLAVATQGDGSFGAAGIVGLFLLEAVGGVALGLGAGWLAFVAIRSTDDRNLELMISLALVAATYSIAGLLGVSGPVAVVVAGIMAGSQGVRQALGEESHARLAQFWSLIERVLNALLFLLIGLEIAAIELGTRSLVAAVVCVPLCLLARLASVLLAGLPLNLREAQRAAGVLILTWGGLRGGISVALALSLAHGPARDQLLTACYVVVVFTILVQGLTLEGLARRVLRPTG